ncbi:hypothetical protein ACLB2K_030278 [Fragaria x ananassa]
MSFLNDDLVGQIVNKVTKDDRKSFSEVCTQWFKVEGLSRSSLSVCLDRFDFDLGGLLTRFPNIIDLVVWGSSTTDTHLELIAQNCPKLESIIIYCDDDQGSDDGILGAKCLLALGNRCPKLSKVKFVGSFAVGDSGVVALLHSARHLKALVVLRNRLISDEALRAIGCLSSITLLKLVLCDITDVGLGFLANGSASKAIKELVLATYHGVTDTGVELLCRMCSLERLDLSCRGELVTDIGGVAISTIQTLKELRLESLMSVSDTTMVALAQNCRNLEVLELQECFRVTGAGIRTFSGHKGLRRLGLLGLINFSQVDVEIVALGCPLLESESVLVDSYWSLDPTWSSELMHDNTKRVIKFVHFYS